MTSDTSTELFVHGGANTIPTYLQAREHALSRQPRSKTHLDFVDEHSTLLLSQLCSASPSLRSLACGEKQSAAFRDRAGNLYVEGLWLGHGLHNRAGIVPVLILIIRLVRMPRRSTVRKWVDVLRLLRRQPDAQKRETAP